MRKERKIMISGDFVAPISRKIDLDLPVYLVLFPGDCMRSKCSTFKVGDRKLGDGLPI